MRPGVPAPRRVGTFERRAPRALVMVLVACAALLAAPARADHDADEHSPNVSILSSLSLGELGDMAFWGDRAVVARFRFDDGSTDGFSLLDISDPARPTEIARHVCTGAGWDVSMWRDLLFLSVDNFTPTSGGSCAAAPGEGFMGLKVVSVADPQRPVDVAAVPMPCSGSHTNTILPDLDRPDPRIVVYASSLRYTEDPPEDGCDAIVEVPLRNPAEARVVGSLPGDEIVACHDVAVFMPRKLLAGACQSQLRLYDISDPVAPRLLSSTPFHGPTFQHSAAFSNDGETLITGEENLFYTGFTSACHGGTRLPIGALWFYDVRDPARPRVRSYHQLGRGLEARSPSGGGCSAHNFNVIPSRGGQDVLVTAWYAGGMSVVDFSDPDEPEEVGHYQPDLGDPDRRAHWWAAYWYRGHVYAPNTLDSARGTLDVLAVDDPLVRNSYRLHHLNPQTHEPLADAPVPPPPAAAAPAARPCRRPPARLRIRRARKVLRADLMRRGRRLRRLRVRGRSVRVNLRGARARSYVVRVAYRDRRGRRRVLRRVIRTCRT